MIDENTPLVTVGIPTYNRAKGLERTLNCIINQTYKNLEIVISDNGSDDLTVKTILEKYVGKYTPQITVSIEKEQLYFLGASGVKRRLLALGEDYFLIEDASVSPENQARLRFVRNAAGAVTELQLMVADGRTFPRVREG